KKEGSSAIHRGLGSQAWTAFCRLQHVVGKTGPAEQTVVLAASKANLSRKPKSLGYRVEPERVFAAPADPGGLKVPIDTSRLEWLGEVEFAADDVSSANRKPGRPPRQDAVREAILGALEG